jgi:hypothetical protein
MYKNTIFLNWLTFCSLNNVCSKNFRKFEFQTFFDDYSKYEKSEKKNDLT